MKSEESILENMLPANKYNIITRINDKVRKTGPTHFLQGEIFFYKNIQINTSINNDNSKLIIEYISSIPFYTLFKHRLINKGHIKQLFDFIDILHNIPGEVPSVDDMKANYINKLQYRFSIREDYPFPDATIIQDLCLSDLSSYIPSGVPCIHGDLWFSNILIDSSGSFKYIDMKGIINGKLHIGGDRLYDYGKLYQSFLGYDAVLYGDTIDEIYRSTMTEIFMNECKIRDINIHDLYIVTRSLVIGTFHSIKEDITKQRIWDFLKTI